MHTLEELRQAVLATPIAARFITSACERAKDPQSELREWWDCDYRLELALQVSERMTRQELEAQIATENAPTPEQMRLDTAMASLIEAASAAETDTLEDLRRKVLANPQACRLLTTRAAAYPDPRRKLAMWLQNEHALRRTLEDAACGVTVEETAAMEAESRAEQARLWARAEADHAERNKLYEPGSILDSVISAAKEAVQ